MDLMAEQQWSDFLAASEVNVTRPVLGSTYLDVDKNLPLHSLAIATGLEFSSLLCLLLAFLHIHHLHIHLIIDEHRSESIYKQELS
jgi:hypothetical protein